MMTKLLSILFSFVSFNIFAQVKVASPYMPSMQERLYMAARNVFKSNKFLNFKDRDVLRYYVDNSLFKQENLHDYFNYERDWDELLHEDTASYRKAEEQYDDRKYAYTDSTMTQYYSKGGAYSISRQMKIVLSPKAFVLLEEEKVSFQDKVVEIRSIINEYDAQNRIIRIINKIEKQQKEENTQSTTDVQYKGDTIIITTEDGTIRYELSKDPNSIGYVSKLSGLETYDRFKYAIYGKRYKDVGKLASTEIHGLIERDSTFYNSFNKIDFGKGTSTHGSDFMRYVEEWKVTFANGLIKNMSAKTELAQTPKGWKVNEFTVTEIGQ